MTDSKKDPLYLYGIPVVSIEDLAEKRQEVIVIVAVNEKYRKEVLSKLSELEFDNVVADGVAYGW